MDSEYSKWLKDFGRSLLEVRKRNGKTQSGTALKIKYSLRFYQDVENGRRPITTRTMFQICYRLGIPAPKLPRRFL